MDVDDLPDEYWVLVIAGISSFVGENVIRSLEKLLHHHATVPFMFQDIFGVPSGAPLNKVEQWYYSTPESRRLIDEFAKKRSGSEWES